MTEIQDTQELTEEGNRQGIRERGTDTCQRFRTLSSLQGRGIGRESERGRGAYSGGE
jgi:hypothetical protein